MKDRKAPPAVDEFELSVFGPRKGESIIIHFPGGEWVVVDSFWTRVGSQRLSVAQAYLDALSVTKLSTVLLTHWHSDHTGGAAALLSEFAATINTVGLPPGFGKRELSSFVADLLPLEISAEGIRDILEVMNALRRPLLSHVRKLYLQDAARVSGSGWCIDALSPSFEDVRDQLASLRSQRSQDPNDACAVLRVSWAGGVVILCSDLSEGADDQRGWRCVTRVHATRLTAEIVKIGHHGSPTAYYEPAWRAMSAARAPDGVVTLFPARGSPLPRNNDLKRYSKICRRLHLTGTRGSNRTRAVTAGRVKVSDTPFDGYIRDYTGEFSSMGFVRYRMRSTESEPRVEAFHPARRVS